MLLKCFVERSYKSGRGKIISVSKDGLNDQYAFVANASLWDADNQCKPAFYSVVNVGLYYNTLDSLISYAEDLNETKYTTESWSNLSSALSSAQSTISANYSYNVSAVDALGEAKDSLDSAINGLVEIITDDINEIDNTPESFTLYQNYPNPFNPVTNIKYSTPQSGYITLKVYNLLGEEVAVLFEGFRSAGNYNILFNGSDLPSGIYFYRLKSSSFVETKKLVLMK